MFWHCKQESKKLGKYKASKSLIELCKRTKKTKDCLQTLKETKSMTEKIKKVGEFLVYAQNQNKPAERTAIYEPTSKSLPTDETEILDATLKYNIEVLTINGIQPQDLKHPRKGLGCKVNRSSGN